RSHRDQPETVGRELQIGLVATLLVNRVALFALAEGRYGGARARHEEGKAMHERSGDEPNLQFSLHNLGLIAMEEGDYRRARADLESALEIAEKHGLEQQMANSLCDLGFAELGDGRLAQARLRFGPAIAGAARLGW